MLLVLGLETSCGMIRTHFISIPWMLWTLQKQKQYRASHPCQSLQRHPCASLASYSLLQQPSHVPFISDWTKNIGSNQRCFKHLNSKIFGLGSTHNREWFFFFLKFGHWIRKSPCTIPHSPATPRQEQAVYAQKYRSEEIIYTNLKFKEDQSSIFL